MGALRVDPRPGGNYPPSAAQSARPRQNPGRFLLLTASAQTPARTPAPRPGLWLLRKLGLITRSLDETGAVTRCGLFYGDIPPTSRSGVIGTLQLPEAAGGGTAHFVGTDTFVTPRPRHTLHRDVTCMPSGYAWVGGRLDVSLSAHPVYSGRTMLRERLMRRGLTLPRATLVHSQFPETYGDWVSEHIRCIALNPGFPEPLVLPAAVAARAYVRHELDQLGIAWVAADRPVLIREATVLHKPTPGTYWTAEDAEAYRRLYGIDPPPARPGSILYLSRRDVTSDQKAAQRDYRSDEIARIVEALGGRVVETGRLSRDDYAAFAEEAETVIADHGSAVFNILQWRTRNLIEIVTDNWWSRSLLFLGIACGVGNHAILRCDGRSEEALSRAISDQLRAFGAPAAAGQTPAAAPSLVPGASPSTARAGIG
jgi:hypothetical protein